MSNTRLIINILLTGDIYKSKEISEKIETMSGRQIKVQDIASMLSRISDAKKCDLGYFILREKDGNGYVYRFANELLDMTEEQVYGLTLKTGKDRFPLEQAIDNFPKLEEYVISGIAAKAPKARTARKKTRKIAPKPVKRAVKKVAKKTAKAAPAKKVAKKVKAAPVKKIARKVPVPKVAKVKPAIVADKKSEGFDIKALAAEVVKELKKQGGLELSVKLGS